MPITRTKCIQIAAAAGGNPASVDANGQVDVSGLTFRTIECDVATVSWGGETPVREDNTAAAGFEGRAPYVATMCGTNGTPGRKMSGTVDITGIPWRGYGNGVVGGAVAQANITEMPFAQVLSSGLSIAEHGNGLVLVSAAGANAGEFQSNTQFDAGEVILTTIAGKTEAARVTSVTGAGPYTMTVSPYFSAALGANDEVYRGATFQTLTGSNTGSVGAALAMKVPTAEGTLTGALLRLQRLRLYLDGGYWMADATLRAEYLDADITASDTITNPDRTTGTHAKMLGVNACFSTSASPEDIDAGWSVDRVALPSVNPDVEIVIEHTLAPLVANDTIVGASDLEITGTTVTCTFGTNTIYDAVRNDMYTRTPRMFVFPGCPIDDGTTQSNGFAAVLSAAYQTADASVLGLDGELIEQRFQLTAGVYGGDDGSEVYKNAPVALYMGNN